MLLAATALLWFVATVLQRGLLTTTAEVRDTASPAYLNAVQASAVLSDADRAAWQSFRSGGARDSGPGQQYQNDITRAGQALERLAAADASSRAESSQLQTISGQLVNYESLVEQADAQYHTDVASRSGSQDDLGFVYLAYASSALRNPQGGLLASIRHLTAADQQALRSQMTSPWADPALLLIFGLPALFLMAGITAAQAFVQRKFRRMVSPPLLLAAALAVGLSAWMTAAVLHADSAFSAARSTALPAVTRLWQDQIRSVNAEAAALQASSSPGVPRRASGGLDAAATAQATSVLNTDLATADDAEGLTIGIPALAFAIAVLTYIGLRLRLIEYRGTGDATG